MAQTASPELQKVLADALANAPPFDMAPYKASVHEMLESAKRWQPGQPIEAAPRDGTRILAYSPTKKRFRVTWWRQPKDEAGFIGWGEFNERHWPATMWWPLPPVD